MKNKKLFIWVLIIAVAILVSAAIILPPALALTGAKNYQEKEEISAERMSTPEDVAADFYAWYLESFGDPATGTFRSPAYHDSEYLTPSFIEHVDEVLASFDGMGGYDPFLCAQNIPQEVIPGGTFYHNGQASVILRTNFPNHVITVDLQESDEQWQISNITCGFSPDGLATAFYTWYLAYIGDPGSDSFRNPLVDRAYRECGFLSDSFVQELDNLLAEGIPADPILLAQDIPHDFTVDPGFEEGTAIVHLQFGTETIRHLKVSMVQDLGAWKIDTIEQFQ
ncbi:MAG: hypothetical protein ACK2U1_03905 [Anaerolineales bacterium]|jgi:hypothetical protein